MTTLTVTALEEVIAAVREHGRVVPAAGLTKQPLIPDDDDAVRLNLTGLRGVTEYQPDEFTFTARAGTRLSEIRELLAAHGQYMPFDPPLAEQGATLGGALAAGLNGSGRLRYGGLRDFVIGVRFVDGTGKHVRGGGKVVKNAAGFDLPRLMVGSIGRLGVITELTFKVFPAPRAWCSLRVTCRDLEDGVACMADLVRRPLDLEALDLEPPTTLLIRVAGDEASLGTHAQRVGKTTQRPYELMIGESDANYWRAQRAFSWLKADHYLIKVPLTLRRLAQLERAAERQGIARRYSVAGNVAWLAWPVTRPIGELDLAGLSGQLVRGPSLHGASPMVGALQNSAAAFARSVKSALDPRQRLPALV
jgi:glycolate oxidase FAD binding subunit